MISKLHYLAYGLLALALLAIGSKLASTTSELSDKSHQFDQVTEMSQNLLQQLDESERTRKSLETATNRRTEEHRPDGTILVTEETVTSKSKESQEREAESKSQANQGVTSSAHESSTEHTEKTDTLSRYSVELVRISPAKLDSYVPNWATLGFRLANLPLWLTLGVGHPQDASVTGGMGLRIEF